MGWIITKRGKVRAKHKHHAITYKKKNYRITDLARLLDIKPSTLFSRVRLYLEGTMEYEMVIADELISATRIYKVGKRKGTAEEFAKEVGIPVSNMVSRLSKNKRGLMKDENVFINKSRKMKFVMIDGKKYSITDIAKVSGCSKPQAYKRCRLFNAGKISEHAVLKAVTDNFVDFEIDSTAKVRKKLDDIPCNGTWEVANLNPSSFVGSDRSGGISARVVE